ncbi:hypothetical protein BJX64DRAFT_258731 [Aspergillus heterothallicus]
MEFKLPILSQFLGFDTPRNPFTDPPKSRLQQLPAELHLLILQYLKQADKLRLLRTSRYFYDLLLSLIYEHLNPRNTQGLVDALVRKPSLCSYPRSLRLSSWRAPLPGMDSDDGRNIDLDLILLRYDISVVSAKAREASSSAEETAQWQKDLKRQNPDAWTGLLLTLLPNLTRLDICFPEHSTYVPRVIFRAATGDYSKSLPVLQNVEEVAVSAAFELDERHISSLVSPFIGLPRLRWFFTDALSDYSNLESYMSHTNSPITHLSLGWNRSGLETLDRLVSLCPQLESFRYGYFPYSWCNPALNRHIQPALLQRKHTLKTLWLDINRGRSRDDSQIWPSFAEFSALELLHAPHYLLGHFDHDSPTTERRTLQATLPESLKTLHVTEVGTGAVDYLFPCLAEYVLSPRVQLAELVVVPTTFLPDSTDRTLKVSTVNIPDPDSVQRATGPKSVMDHAVELGNACRASGTKISIHRKDSRALRRWWFQEPFPRRDMR